MKLYTGKVENMSLCGIMDYFYLLTDDILLTGSQIMDEYFLDYLSDWSTDSITDSINGEEEEGMTEEELDELALYDFSIKLCDNKEVESVKNGDFGGEIYFVLFGHDAREVVEEEFSKYVRQFL